MSVIPAAGVIDGGNVVVVMATEGFIIYNFTLSVEQPACVCANKFWGKKTNVTLDFQESSINSHIHTHTHTRYKAR